VQERQELVYYDRYAGELREERIYGEKPLRWIYETPAGGLTLEAVVKRAWFSALYGRWADCGCSAGEVARFIERFGLDTGEFLDPPESFRSFNEFFYRRLKPGARPVAAGGEVACFPADGRHLYIADLDETQSIYAKGQRFDLAAFLGDAALAARYAGGSAVLSRLCPTDYHRFHFPLGGLPGAPRPVRGALYSVNPIALARRLSYLWRNKRQITEIRGEAGCDYLYAEIGATNVGGIVDTFEPGSPMEKGAEKGYFRFGGSMVAVLFPTGRFEPADDLRERSAAGVELYARCGDAMGRVRGRGAE